MRQTPTLHSAEIAVEFAHAQRDDSIGPEISWDAEFCKMPPMETIPDLVAPKKQNSLGIAWPVFEDPMNQLNPDYFRELADYEFVRRLFRPVRLLVRNVGEVGASNVRCELEIPAGIGVHIESHLPDAPTRRSSLVMTSTLKNAIRASRPTPGDIAIDRNDERYRIEVECCDLQPGRRIWSDVFYIGKKDSGILELSGRVYAANLPKPKDFALRIATNIVSTTMSVQKLMHPSEPTDQDV